MLDLSFLSKHISLEGWSFSRQMQSCEARHEQDFFKSNTFASGLRSEYSNHSWLILAGSSCNLAAMVYQKFDPLECGLGTHHNDWVNIHPWAHFAVHKHSKCNPIQTTLRLSWIQPSEWWIHSYSRDWDDLSSLPHLTRPCWVFGVQTDLFYPSDGTCQCHADWIFFLAFFAQSRMLMKGFLRSRCAQGEIIHLFAYLWDCSSMMKSFAFHIRSFHSSILLGVTPPMRNALHSPLVCAEPKKQYDKLWATGISWCAGRKVGVGAMRDYLKVTFLWMSEPRSINLSPLLCWWTHANGLFFL